MTSVTGTDGTDINESQVKSEDDLDRLAREELVKEIKRGAERAKDMGAYGWVKPSRSSTDKKFLGNVLVSTLRSHSRNHRTDRYKHRKHSKPRIKLEPPRHRDPTLRYRPPEPINGGHFRYNDYKKVPNRDFQDKLTTSKGDTERDGQRSREHGKHENDDRRSRDHKHKRKKDKEKKKSKTKDNDESYVSRDNECKDNREQSNNSDMDNKYRGCKRKEIEDESLIQEIQKHTSSLDPSENPKDKVIDIFGEYIIDKKHKKKSKHKKHKSKHKKHIHKHDDDDHNK